MEVCMYCGDERAGKFVCCGEVHFEEVIEQEDEQPDEPNLSTTGETQ